MCERLQHPPELAFGGLTIGALLNQFTGEVHQSLLTKHNIHQLTALVKTRLRQMQYRPGLLDGFLAKTGLDLTPLQRFM